MDWTPNERRGVRGLTMCCWSMNPMYTMCGRGRNVESKSVDALEVEVLLLCPQLTYHVIMFLVV